MTIPTLQEIAKSLAEASQGRETGVPAPNIIAGPGNNIRQPVVVSNTQNWAGSAGFSTEALVLILLVFALSIFLFCTGTCILCCILARFENFFILKTNSSKFIIFFRCRSGCIQCCLLLLLRDIGRVLLRHLHHHCFSSQTIDDGNDQLEWDDFRGESWK